MGKPHPVDIHVGSRVRQRRTLLGMSQEKLGDAVGLTFQQIQKYERGANRIGCSRLYEFSKVLDVPVAYFFEDMPVNVLVGRGGRGRGRGLAENAAEYQDEKDPLAKRETLAGAIICTGFPPRQHEHLDAQFAISRALLREADDLRRTGSAALDLAYVAAGRLDGYFEPGLQPWDMAAGCLLVREAGGKFCDFAGRDGMPASGNLVAGNIHVAAAMVKVITANATPELLA